MIPVALFPPLQAAVDAFEWVLLRIHDLGFGWGLSIVLLTCLVRFLLLPLTIKQFRSMQELARYQPEVAKLRDKYKDDPQRLQQETMKFYREHKINPLASCLPLLAQFPVFISLFYMLREDLRVDICPEKQGPDVLQGDAKPVACGPGSDHGFLFIDDLTTKATGGVLVALLLLYIGSQLLSSLLNMTTATDKTQRTLFLALPFVFTIFVINFPAGLLVYWITTNIWTIGQQTIIKRRIGPVRPHSETEGEAPRSLLGSMLRPGAAPPPAKDAKGAAASDDSAAKRGSGPSLEKGGGGKQAAEGKAAGAKPAGAKPAGKPRGGPPPASPRKKKKRSGRRR